MRARHLWLKGHLRQPPAPGLPSSRRAGARQLALRAVMALGAFTLGLAGAVGNSALSPSPASAATGSAVLPSSDFTNYSPVTMGGTDDSSWPCGPSTVSGPIACPVTYNGTQYTGPAAFPFGFNLDVFGTEYGGAYVNTNGNITFGSYLSTYTPYGLEGTSSVIIAPFFADVDTRKGNPVTIATGDLDGHRAFIVDWPGVGCYEENDTVTDNFQLVLIDRPDLGTSAKGDDFQIEMNYASIEWDAGQVSGGNSACTDASNSGSAAAGYSDGTSNPDNTYQMPGSQESGALLNSNTTTGLAYNDLNSDSVSSLPPSSAPVPGRYIFNVNNGQPEAPTSVQGALTGGGDTGTDISALAGTAVTDKAALSGANTGGATGTVTYTVYSDGTCATQVASGGTVNVTNGSVPASSQVTLTEPGTYYWEASYSGDSLDGPSSTGCTQAETVWVPPGTTTTGTVYDAVVRTPWSANSPVTGATAYYAAAVAPNYSHGPAPTGRVTYDLYATGSCTGSATGGPVPLSDGLAPASATTSALAAGSYSYQATYSGDSNYDPSSSQCQGFSVARAAPALTTTVDDSATQQAWSGSEATGTAAYDTAALSGVNGFSVTGTVTYDFYNNSSCTGTATSTGTVALSGGAVPNSAATPRLQAGSYGFQASYSGDSNYAPTTGPCQAFSAALAAAPISTTVDDATTGHPWDGTEVAGATAFDTATLSTSGGYIPAGQVTYSIYNNGSCSGTAVTNDAVTLSGGLVPHSSTTWALVPGSYSYRAAYSGNDDYAASTAACEPFTVAQRSASLSAVVYDSRTGAPWAINEGVGDTAYDLASLSTAGGPTPTGSVTYSLYQGASCPGTPVATGTVTISGGTIPRSAVTPALAARPYSFEASYSGDADYHAVAGTCESFSATQAAASVASTVKDAATGDALAGAEVAGATVYDTATVDGLKGFAPTGTVTYSFFRNSSCTGASSPAGAATVTAGTAPPSSTTASLAPGSYSYEASYSGDSNYLPASGSCEPFTVAKTSASVTTKVYDAASNAPWSTGEAAGATAYDTAQVNGLSRFAPSGTITYTFFKNGSCTAPPSSSGAVTLSGGTAAHSATTPALATGQFSFEATYSGDTTYLGPTAAACENFSTGLAALKVSAPVVSLTYGQALAPMTPTYSGFVKGDTVRSLTAPATCQTTATATSPPGSYPVTCSGAVDPNYTISYVAGTVTIKPATLVVTAPKRTITAGTAVPTLSPTYTGFVNGGTVGSLTSKATCKTSATSSSPPGHYPVTCSGAVAAGYAIHYVTGTITIVKASTTKAKAPAKKKPAKKAPAKKKTSSSKAKTVKAKPAVPTYGGRRLAITPTANGWWVLSTKGKVSAYAKAHNYGSPTAKESKSAVAIAATPDGKGYWITGAKGSVYRFGDAHLYGSPAKRRLAAPITAMASAPNGKGYWLAGADGGVFSYGSAHFYGSKGGRPITGKIVAITPTSTGKGYWLVSSKGAVYAFGNARAHGSEVHKHLVSAIVGIARTPDGKGYWLIGGDGGIFNFGDAHFYGSDGGKKLTAPMVGLIASASAKTYSLVNTHGKATGFPKKAASSAKKKAASSAKKKAASSAKKKAASSAKKKAASSAKKKAASSAKKKAASSAKKKPGPKK